MSSTAATDQRVAITPDCLVCAEAATPTTPPKMCRHDDVCFQEPVSGWELEVSATDRSQVASLTYYGTGNPQAICRLCGAQVVACFRCGHRSLTTARLEGRMLSAHQRGATHRLQAHSADARSEAPRVLQCMDCGLPVYVDETGN